MVESNINIKQRAATNGMLLSAALLWGSGYAVRKVGLTYVTPFFFNSFRFLMGFLFLLAIFLVIRRRPRKQEKDIQEETQSPVLYQVKAGLIVGSALALASGLQQWSLLSIPVGKASFITALYTIFVPIFSLIFFKMKVRKQVWAGVVLTIIGIYLINGGTHFTVAFGDIMVFFSAILFAVEILAVAHYSPKCDGLFLCLMMYFFGSIWNFIFAFIFERGNTLEGLVAAAGPILYSGIFALGIPYFFQILAQRKANPSVAAIIVSLESVFAGVFGAIFLHERMALIQILGCAMIFAAVVIAQIRPKAAAIEERT